MSEDLPPQKTVPPTLPTSPAHLTQIEDNEARGTISPENHIKPTSFITSLYSGRLTRKQFLMYAIPLTLFSSAFASVSFFELPSLSLLSAFVSTILCIFVTWPIIVKRAHDIGHKGLIAIILGLFSLITSILFNVNSNNTSLSLLACLTSIPAAVYAIILFFKDSEKGTNQYGTSSKYPDVELITTNSTQIYNPLFKKNYSFFKHVVYSCSLVVVLYVTAVGYCFSPSQVASRGLKSRGIDENQISQRDWWDMYHKHDTYGVGYLIEKDKAYAPTFFAEVCKKQDDVYVRLCIEHDLDVNKANDEGKTPLFYIVNSNEAPTATELLIQAGANVNKEDAYGSTPLFYAAACYDNIKNIKLLIDAGANVNKVNNNGENPLLAAVKGAMSSDAIKLLIEAGADINKADNHGDTPILIAAKRDYEGLVRLLIENGAVYSVANVNKASYGRTPLHGAVCINCIEWVKLLIEAGADVNVADDKGKTPLYLASEKGYTDIVKLLIEAGAQVNVKTKMRRTPLDAAKNGEIQKILREAGAKYSWNLD